MARPLRIEYEGAVYHVTSRGNAGEIVFRDEKDRGNILATIKKRNTRGQRYASRPGLDVLFDEEIKGDRKKRKEKVQEAVERHGYSQKEVADYIGVHYSVISKLLKG
ncbi:MAG: helix-turn-helix transcriptional regulator [Nitrospirota bacterium]|nr:helix-turn-helix transcriptional regulator [Nitrospirota bacterium]